MNGSAVRDRVEILQPDHIGPRTPRKGSLTDLLHMACATVTQFKLQLVVRYRILYLEELKHNVLLCNGVSFSDEGSEGVQDLKLGLGLG